jgi:hypothetical protein
MNTHSTAKVLVLILFSSSLSFIAGAKISKLSQEHPVCKIECLQLPRTKCTKYDWSGPNGSKFCYQWKRVL